MARPEVFARERGLGAVFPAPVGSPGEACLHAWLSSAVADPVPTAEVSRSFAFEIDSMLPQRRQAWRIRFSCAPFGDHQVHVPSIGAPSNERRIMPAFARLAKAEAYLASTPSGVWSSASQSRHRPVSKKSGRRSRRGTRPQRTHTSPWLLAMACQAARWPSVGSSFSE